MLRRVWAAARTAKKGSKFKDNGRLLIMSYYSGFPARVTSEWVEDRIRVTQELGLRVTLITGPQSKWQSSENLKVFRVPSLSFQDFRFELREMRGNRGRLGRDILWVIPWLLLSIPLGSFFDLVFRVLAGERSSGMYSWTCTSGLVGVVVGLHKELDRIYATGGPSSAQIAGTITGILTRTPVYLEFQDPFIGSEMIVSKSASSVLEILEHFFMENAAQISVVTKKAGDDLVARYPKLRRKILAEHPGSWDFGIRSDRSAPEGSAAHKVLITHLGTLYGKRNLDSLFEAVDLLPEDLQGRIHIRNVGGVFVDKTEEYRTRNNFTEVSYMPRVASLKLAAESDILLLVQHTDSRSEETIPYKTYDYLNLNLPIFALVNNPELEALVLELGGTTADVKSPRDIARGLEGMLLEPRPTRAPRGKVPNVKETFLRLLGLESR